LQEAVVDLTFYSNFESSVAQQEAQINLLQSQVSTGLAVQTPEQNPAAYGTATFSNDQISQLSADNTTQAALQSQLGSVSDVYASVSSLFDSVQSVIEQALNATSSPQDLQTLSTQVSSAATQLVGLANTTGSTGQYLFGGSRGTVAPFQTGADGSIVYLGDGGQSQVSVAPGDNVSALTNGEVFTAGLSGDGTVSVTANAGNTGTGTLTGQVVNPSAAAAFQAGNTPITLSFAQGASGLTYTATSGGSTIASGAVTSGQSLQLAGEDFTIAGTPASGDSFTLSPSRPQSAFSLLQTVASALAAAASTPAAAAQTRQVLDQSLATLSQYQQGVLTAQAQNGVTLQAVNNANAANANQTTSLETSVQNATGANIPVAIASLDQSVTALQAAMKAFGDVQNLSLFSYL
jgi:flagellar hook-associated protein 3 FlgL